MNKLVTARPSIEPRLPERRRGKQRKSGWALPALIAGTGPEAARRFRNFFTVNIRNKNTRAAYTRAAAVFLRWCEGQGIAALGEVQPVHAAAYIEQLQAGHSAPTVK
jgi:integrase/recombinase XerD